jgi:hypothetical protein
MNTPSIVNAERILLRANACTAAPRIIPRNAQSLAEEIAPVFHSGAARAAAALSRTACSVSRFALFRSSETIKPSRIVIMRLA